VVVDKFEGASMDSNEKNSNISKVSSIMQWLSLARCMERYIKPIEQGCHNN
jgi:hypothetical protein